MVGFQIACNVGAPAVCEVSLPYSPWIINLRRDTKFQIWRQDTPNDPPELEFDGVVVAKSESRDSRGNASFSFTGKTDCDAWLRRKRYDIDVMNLMLISPANEDTGYENAITTSVTNFTNQMIKESAYDAGIAFCSLNTSDLYLEPVRKSGEKGKTVFDSLKLCGYQYFYNGIVVAQNLNQTINGKTYEFGDSLPHTHWWYYRFLVNYGLARKVYGVPSFSYSKNYAKAGEFGKWMSDGAFSGCSGLTNFLQSAVSLLNYVQYEFCNIPRATYIPQNAKNVKVYKSSKPLTDSEYAEKIKALQKSLLKDDRQYPGIAEFILMPECIFKIPPKCNVIYPNQIISMSMNQEMSSVITRNRYMPKVLDMPIGKTYVGPSDVANDNIGGYFSSFSHSIFDRGHVVQTLRNDKDISPYEREYGVNLDEFTPNSAYDILMSDIGLNTSTGSEKKDPSPDALRKKLAAAKRRLKDSEDGLRVLLSPGTKAEAEKIVRSRRQEVVEIEGALSKATQDPGKAAPSAKEILRKMLNYHFVKEHFKRRNLSIQVDSTVDVAPGHGLLILSDYGSHIFALCTGYSKSWSASGSYNVGLYVAYPRYYHEDISGVGLANDFILGDYENRTEKDVEDMLQMTMKLIGCEETIMSDPEFRMHNVQVGVVENLYKQWKTQYNAGTFVATKRKTTTFRDFLEFHLFGNLSTRPIDLDSYTNQKFSKMDSYANIPIQKKDRSRETDTMPPSITRDFLKVFDSSRGADFLSTSKFRVDDVLYLKSNSEMIESHNKSIAYAQKL